jgi:hypothetical protein
LLDWLRVEYAIEKPSNKLLAATELDSDTWVAVSVQQPWGIAPASGAPTRRPRRVTVARAASLLG